MSVDGTTIQRGAPAGLAGSCFRSWPTTTWSPAGIAAGDSSRQSIRTTAVAVYAVLVGRDSFRRWRSPTTTRSLSAPSWISVPVENVGSGIGDDEFPDRSVSTRLPEY